MALRLIEGWDHFSSVALAALKQWTITPGGTQAPSISFVPGRVSGQGIQIGYGGSGAGSAPCVKFLTGTPIATGTWGGAWFISTHLPTGASINLFRIRSGVNRTCDVAITIAGHISVTNAAGTVVATGTATLVAGAYFYVEVKITVNGASGTVQTWINGIADIASTVANMGTAGVNMDNILLFPDTIQAGPTTNQGGIINDDIYCTDTLGGVNTAQLGDVHVETIYPNADGNYSQWTPNTGTAHFSLVNEHTTPPFPDSDTTYVSSATLNQLDSYTYDDLIILVGTIFGIQTNLWSRKDDAVARQIAPLVRLSGVDYIGNNVTLATSYADGTQIYDTSPGTGVAWTITEINAAEFGVKVTL
jgi:hypothetical protein